MKKIRINEVIVVKDIKDQTIGQHLEGILEKVPAGKDASGAVKQHLLTEELKKSNNKKEEWFIYEEAEHSIIEAVLDNATQGYLPRVIALIKIAHTEAKSFKGEEPKEEPKENK